MSEDSSKFDLLQSVYSWPNMILPLFGGIFIDSFGIRKTMVAFMILIFSGQLIFSIALSTEQYWLALVGR
jgi:MFS family permease